MGDSRTMGRTAEDRAAKALERKGMTILARNWQIRPGELDIVAMDGGTICFVEVKARSGDFAHASSAVNRDKKRRLRRLAAAYIAFERPQFEGARFDVVSVTRERIEHLPNAFD